MNCNGRGQTITIVNVEFVEVYTQKYNKTVYFHVVLSISNRQPRHNRSNKGPVTHLRYLSYGVFMGGGDCFSSSDLNTITALKCRYKNICNAKLYDVTTGSVM